MENVVYIGGENESSSYFKQTYDYSYKDIPAIKIDEKTKLVSISDNLFEVESLLSKLATNSLNRFVIISDKHHIEPKIDDKENSIFFRLKTRNQLYIGLDKKVDTTILEDGNFTWIDKNKLEDNNQILDFLDSELNSHYLTFIISGKSSLNSKIVNNILKRLKNNIKNLIFYNLHQDQENNDKQNNDKQNKENKFNRELAIKGEEFRSYLKEVFNVKEKNLNIFTEDSRFLIYRPMSQNNEEDYGWYILRNTPKEYKETILKKLEINNIIDIEIDNEDFLLSSTTINEQNDKSYYFCNSILDTVLYPQEKQSMIFELIN